MSERRFFVPPGDLDEGTVALIRGTEHHHLSRVLRLKAGDEVFVFDGDGRGYKGFIESIENEASRVRLTAPDDRAVEPAFRLTLAQGIPHHDKMELIIQKATEIGVAAIVPIVAQRTVVRAERGGAWKRIDRWRRVARESARQSGRLRVPPVEDPLTWEEFMTAPEGGSESPRFILCPQAPGPASQAPDLGLAAGAATVAVGPEGGWADEEISRAMQRGFRQLALGPRVLRTETAGIVGVALLLFLAGELGPAVEGRAEP